jgi:hypothetical protein
LRRCLRTIDNFGDWLGEIREFLELRRQIECTGLLRSTMAAMFLELLFTHALQ